MPESATYSKWKATILATHLSLKLINGKEAAAKIIRNDKVRNVPLILFTTARNGNDELFCRKKGLHLVYKPWSFTETLKTIEDILDNYTLS